MSGERHFYPLYRFYRLAHMIYCMLQHFNYYFKRKIENENIEKGNGVCMKIHLMTY